MSSRISLSQAISVTPLDSHRYGSDFPVQYSNGSAAHGGLVAALFAQTARVHLDRKGENPRPSHLLRLHVEYLRPVQAGKAGIFVVEDVRIGSITSLIHIDLQQDNKSRARAYVCHIHDTPGLLIAANNSATAINRSPVPQIVRGSKSDRDWVRCWISEDLYSKVRTNFEFVLPRKSTWCSTAVEEWIAPRANAAGGDSKERFSTESLGLVADLWPQIADSFSGSPYSAPGMVQQALAMQPGGKAIAASRIRVTDKDIAHLTPVWYPTVTLDLHIKKPLPAEGEQWLWQKVWAEEIASKGMDVQLRIANRDGDLVAIGHLAVMVVDAGRNTGRDAKM